MSSARRSVYVILESDGQLLASLNDMELTKTIWRSCSVKPAGYVQTYGGCLNGSLSTSCDDSKFASSRGCAKELTDVCPKYHPVTKTSFFCPFQVSQESPHEYLFRILTNICGELPSNRQSDSPSVFYCPTWIGRVT